MEGSEQIAAQLAAARLEILQAEQALDELDRQWQVQHALAEVEIAQLQRQAALAQDRLDGLLAPVEAERLAQVSANLRLAQRQLENAQSDLRKAQKRYDNKSSIIWYFINQRTVRLHLAQLEGAVVKAQRRYDDAAEKLDELQSPPDAVDVAVAAAGLQAAQSRLADAQRRAAELQDGPRQEELELARLRLQSAQAAQLAAQEALEALRLKAPFDGVVVAAPVEAGEWLAAGQEVVLLADTSAWDVEAADVTEEIAAGLQAGAPVVVRLDAYPDVELSGRIEQVDLISREGDDEVYFPLRVRIIEAEPRLRWGLTVRLEILP
jgi:multidrug resistance efflux pump